MHLATKIVKLRANLSPEDLLYACTQKLPIIKQLMVAARHTDVACLVGMAQHQLG
jgi:hypothetical protein